MSGKRIEVIGLMLILSAAFWELAVLREGYYLYVEAPFNVINQKLDYFWWSMMKGPPEYHREHMAQYHQLIESAANGMRRTRQAFLSDWAAKFRLALFFTGSVIVIYGKWKDGTPAETKPEIAKPAA